MPNTIFYSILFFYDRNNDNIIIILYRSKTRTILSVWMNNNNNSSDTTSTYNSVPRDFNPVKIDSIKNVYLISILYILLILL